MDKRIQQIPGIMDGNHINRLEIQDSKGRAYVNTALNGIEFLIQDDGRTLKIIAHVKQET